MTYYWSRINIIVDTIDLEQKFKHFLILFFFY